LEAHIVCLVTTQPLWESESGQIAVDAFFRDLKLIQPHGPCRSVLDEDHTLFGGTYAGANSLPAVRQEIENADFVLMAGKLESDFK
jgi:TPP-dependent 2-oxoacid decarboxylase